MLRAIHFSPLPCSDLGQGVATIITAFTPFHFFAQARISQLIASAIEQNLLTCTPG